MKRDHVELAVNLFFVVLLSINQSKYENKRKYAWIDNRKVDGQLVLEKVPEEVDWEQADSPRCWCWYTASCRLHYRPLSSKSWQFHILTQQITERKSMILEFKMQRAELIDSNLFPTERTMLFFLFKASTSDLTGFHDSLVWIYQALYSLISELLPP